MLLLSPMSAVLPHAHQSDPTRVSSFFARAVAHSDSRRSRSRASASQHARDRWTISCLFPFDVRLHLTRLVKKSRGAVRTTSAL
jgi:hypothetical protein